jgi:hypothetical protein
MKTTIITAIYDNYDTLKPALKQSIDVEWVCVTDDKYLCGESWHTIYEPRPHLHPNRAAKTPKMLPWLYASTSTSIWVDASFRVVSSTFAEDVLNYAQPIAQFSHPWRSCAYDEAYECFQIPKYNREVLAVQTQYLSWRKHPKKWGLWATGVIARRHTSQVVQMGCDWLADVHNYSFQDQVSHPDVCRRNDLRPIDLPGTHLANQWLAYEGSGRH